MAPNRYVRRIGKGVAHLSESEIAEQYRARFAGFAGRIDEAARMEAAFQKRLHADGVWLVTTLVPDLPGHFDVDQNALDTFQRGLVNSTLGGFGVPSWSFPHGAVRRRRLVSSAAYGDRPDLHQGAVCELHESGAGTVAVQLARTVGRPDGEPTASPVDDELALIALAGSMGHLGRHARDRANTGGLATLRATLQPRRHQIMGAGNQPMALTESRNWDYQRLGRWELTVPPVADTVADIDDLASEGPNMVAAASRLAGDLWQEFGVAEAAQLTPQGAVRTAYWSRKYRQALEEWSKQHDVVLSDETLS